MYRERGSNPHGSYLPTDFKSVASTNSAIPAYAKDTSFLLRVPAVHVKNRANDIVPHQNVEGWVDLWPLARPVAVYILPCRSTLR